MRKLIPVLALLLFPSCGFFKPTVKEDPQVMQARIEREERERLWKDMEKVSVVKFVDPLPNRTGKTVNPKTDILIFSDTPQGRPYTELGSLEVQDLESNEYMTEVIKLTASLMGADAIMKIEFKEVPSKIKERGFYVSNDPDEEAPRQIVYSKRVKGIAIKFKNQK